ncbi:MAG: hypothetical protein DWQ10_09255 [Calditrichaeota bacterium]|nr:MAG: hypothetical protein DWQ10_09255 [Calditrichota bacterium]
MNPRDSILKKLSSINSLQKTPAARTQDRQIYQDYPEETKDELIARFKKQFLALAGEFFPVSSYEKAGAHIFELLKSVDSTKHLVELNPLCQKIFSACPELEAKFENIENKTLAATDFADYATGLTGADFLVARTGSIVLRTNSAGGRRLSVLPPLHIVVATVAQLVPSLDAALQNRGFREGDWSYGTIITGPSRTSDIEKILVLGAHGPKRLALILLDE